jgi:conjugal transfer pilus assembly protein TraD
MRGVEGIATALVLVGLATGAVLAARSMLRGRVPTEEGIVVGRTRERPERDVALGEDEMQQGVVLGGSPGAGKTSLLVAMAEQLPPHIGLGHVDLKGDRSLADRLDVPRSRVFGLGGRGEATWNPLGAGSPASWRDILMATEQWSEPHFRRAAARFLGALLGALAEARDAVRLDEVAAILERPATAAGLLRGLDGRPRDALQRALAAVGGDATLRSGVVGLGNRLALLADSPATAGRFGAPGGIDLADVLRGGRVLFSLPAAEYPDEAPAIAAAAIQSLGAAGQSLARGDEGLRAVLIIDEAPRLGGEQLREAVAIGRGAGIGTVVAVQDFADLDYIADGTREAVETGANTWIVMRQVASAGEIAEALGTYPTRKRTVQHDRHRVLFTETGLESERDVEEFRVSPNVIRDLSRGEAIVWRRLRGRIDHVVTRRLRSMWGQ